MFLKNLNTGRISDEREMMISWEMDTVYDYLNPDDLEPGQGPLPFLDWLKDLLESGDYELYIDSGRELVRTKLDMG